MKECPACKRCFPDETNNCPDDGTTVTPTLVGEPTLDNRYLLERRLGQGGMGLVFKGRHIFLKTQHAIKIILPDLVGNDPMLATRFRQEALAAAAIRHPNVVAVTDFGVVRGSTPFLVMEFVKGKSLHDILNQEGPMPIERAWELISALASGVDAAHRQNIVHRDLKPLNVMVQDDMPVAVGLKILDFGLAKFKSGELLGSFVQAQTSGMIGSPYYMAPEQWSDEELDARADVYSLGVILFQMLSGDVPFKGSSIPSIMKKHLTATPPSFQSFGVSVSPAIEAVVRHSLEKDVSTRIDSVSTFLTDLHAAMNSARVSVPWPRDTGGLDPNKTITSGVTITDTQPPIPAMSTQPPIPADTNFSASASSPPDTVKPPDVERQQQKVEQSIRQAKEIEPPVERSGVSVPPVHQVDLEETRVRAGVTDSVASGLQSSRQVGQPMIISLPAKRKFNPALLAVAAAVILFLTGAGIAAYLIFRPKPPIDEPLVVKAQLIPIEGGTFEMGRNTGPPQETPAHSVRIASFAMDKTEVTNSEYAQFIRESKHEPPSYWGGTNPPAGQELLPVVNVSSQDANAFAAWRSKRDKVTYRLPTEEEWEYAARNGDRGDTYPWGSEWKDRIAVVKESSAAPVGSRPDGKNKWGVVDLVGNVWELTSSPVSVYPGNAATVPNNMKEWVTMRGGCYASDPSKRDTPISSYMRDFLPPNTKSMLLGFRLVRTDN